MTVGWQSAQGRVWELIMMGNDFFGLTKRPFIAEPVPEAYCPFGSTETARVEISRCVERAEGVAFVTGHSGTGKTLLCRTIQSQFDSLMKTVLLNGKNLNHPKAFFESMLTRLNIPFDSRNLSAMRDALTVALETSSQFPNGLLLLIDDAQATGIRVFEEIRQLLDRTSKLERGLRVVLFGDAGLEEKLSFPQLNSFSQRITVRCFLETMNRDETTAFLQAELVRAGGEKQIFPRDVCREIHRFSEGVPRVTNQLADFLLVTVQEELKNAQIKAGMGSQGSNSALSQQSFGEEPSNGDSDSNFVKFEAWDSNSEFPGDGNGIDIFEAEFDDSFPQSVPSVEDGVKQSQKGLDEPSKINAETAKKEISGEDSSSESRQTEKIPEITIEQVRKAWHRLQQLPEGMESTSVVEESAMAKPASSNQVDSINNACTENETQPTSSSIEFGSLDDESDSDLDGEHTIDFDAASSDDPTMAWTYDEMEEVRKAVESANAIPEEWDASAKENAYREEKSEKKDLAPDFASVIVSQKTKKNEGTEPAQVPDCTEDSAAKTEKQELNQTKDCDLWDVYHEHSNIRFPETKRTVPGWIPPSYSSEMPSYSNYSKSISPDSPFTQSSHSFQSTPSTFGISGGISNSLPSRNPGGVSYITPPAARPHSVDELIYDSIMDDTVHSMGLLQKILSALHEENQKNASPQPPAEYWFMLQDSTKGLLRQIARERLGKRAPGSDFYQPENLMEKEIFPQNRSGMETVSGRKEPMVPPVPSASPIKATGTQTAEVSKERNPFPLRATPLSDSPETQEISELRKVLQDCRAQNGFDSNAQERILDIISRLQTLNQYS